MAGMLPDIYIWTADGKMRSLAKAAEDFDASYQAVHTAMKKARDRGRDQFKCKGIVFSLTPTGSTKPEAPEKPEPIPPQLTRSGRPLLLGRGYETHGLGRARR